MIILKNGIEITKLISKDNFSLRYIMKLIYLINETNLRISTQKRADCRGFVSGISELPAMLWRQCELEPTVHVTHKIKKTGLLKTDNRVSTGLPKTV